MNVTRFSSSCSCSGRLSRPIAPTTRIIAKPSRASPANAAPRRTTFLYFDPEDPENVVEVKATAEETLPARTPQQSRALAPQAAGNGETAVAAPLVGKLIEMQKQLTTQLELERQKVMQMQKYEGQYKEWRVMADQMSQEVDHYQKQLYEKDVELTKAYKKLEANAEERVALRKANFELKEMAENLTGQLASNKQIEGGSPHVALPSPEALKADVGNTGGKMAELIKMWPH